MTSYYGIGGDVSNLFLDDIYYSNVEEIHEFR